MYPFSILDANTLMLVAVGVFTTTGLFMALAYRIREERAYLWLSAGTLAFAIGWSLQLSQYVIGINLITIPLSHLFLLLLPIALICASLDFLKLQGMIFALIITTPLLVTLFFILRITMHHEVIPGALTASLNGAMYLATAWIFKGYSYPHNAMTRAIIGANVVIGAFFILRTAVLLYATVLPQGVSPEFINEMVYTTLFVNLVCVLAQALCFPLLDLMRSQSDLSRVNRHLSHVADRDILTGVYNHRAFKVRLEVELQFHKPNRLPLSVILFDIDHFKNVNHHYGQVAGDAVLLGIAEIIESVSRDKDTCARYGDDAFALLLPDTNQEQAIAIAESIRAAIADATTGADAHAEAISDRDGDRGGDIGGFPTAITCAFGVASLNPQMDTPHAIMSSADFALCAAKRNGGNCVYPSASGTDLGSGRDSSRNEPPAELDFDLSLVVTRLHPERFDSD
jgi:diguanylate cyclase (GGDEF)-like protein